MTEVFDTEWTRRTNIQCKWEARFDPDRVTFEGQACFAREIL